MPVNTLLRTTDNTQTFQVIANAGANYFNSVQNAYVVPPGITTFSALVQAVIPGAIGNIQPNAFDPHRFDGDQHFRRHGIQHHSSTGSMARAMRAIVVASSPISIVSVAARCWRLRTRSTILSLD